jgi:hypothetical protein
VWHVIYHEFRRWVKSPGSLWTAARKATITVETDQIWILRRSRFTRAWCAECGREVDTVGLKEAAGLSGQGFPHIHQLALGDSGSTQGWHFAEAPDGSPIVCLESLRKSV